MRQLFTIVASAAIVCCASSSQAQPPPAAGEAVPATATIRGHVVAADTGRPLRRAQVRINSADGKGPGVNRLATTDADGRYEFSGLAAGRYYLFANKSPYVQLSLRTTAIGRSAEGFIGARRTDSGTRRLRPAARRRRHRPDRRRIRRTNFAPPGFGGAFDVHERNATPGGIGQLDDRRPRRVPRVRHCAGTLPG